MNKGMEELISKELNMDINKIRESTWNELLKMPRRKGKAFRPKNTFLVSGNINLTENRTMGTWLLNIRNIYRKVLYEVKCLKHRKQG